MARVLIIGANSAIAQEIAAILARRGDRLYLLARNRITLRGVAEALGDAVVGDACADFRDTDAADSLVDGAIRALGSLDIAIICHGYLGNQLETEADWTAAREVIEANFSSAAAFAIPLANYFEEQGGGKLGVLSTVAGERGRPRNYTYGAAKGALTLFLQGMRSRLWSSGVEIYTFKLGPVDTPMTTDHHKNALFATSGGVAQAVVAKMDRARGGEYFVPPYWGPIMTVVRSMPEFVFQRLSFLSGR